MPTGRQPAVGHMTLEMECWPDELSPAQLAAYQKVETEHEDIRAKFNNIIGSDATSENLYLGEIFSAYELSGAPAAELQEISKPLSAVRKEHQQLRAKQQQQQPAQQQQRLKRSAPSDDYAETIDDDGDNDASNNGDNDYKPGPGRRPNTSKMFKLATDKKRDVVDVRVTPGPIRTGGRFVVTGGVHQVHPNSGSGAVRPSENSSIGGLSVGERQRKDIVDLTKDDDKNMAYGADSREITFNKLQGKTFPSLVVVARPTLHVKDAPNDRPTLDAKVKAVLMYSATKFTEWMIQQGLVRSEQMCQTHSGRVLKLGMYSDASKFAYSGGYLWISECCPARYVSVFNGSLFEGAPHAPSVLLKLIYHWACQTNVQNVVQWVKVDNLYVKGLYTLLRSVCTVALHQHGSLLGGRNKKVEVGVISLGTTSQDGQQRQVKVEVLGVLDPEGRVVRLRAVEPLADGERNYKKRFAKILEPLGGWVHKDSTIMSDLTVDKGTMNAMGFAYVQQSAPADAKSKSCNANIMDYLRRIVPRMFQNTLSLLSRPIIQQFLDELVWREWCGTTPATAFDNIVRHIAEQTRLDAKEPLVGRLAKVSQNPFRNWAHLAVKTPAKALKANFFNNASSTSHDATWSPPGKRGRKRREPSPEPPPSQRPKIQIKEEPRSSASQRKADAAAAQRRADAASAASAAAAAAQRAAEEKTSVHLEAYYYGIVEYNGEPNDSGRPVREQFRAQCPLCHETFYSNVSLMDHLKRHANPPAVSFTGTVSQCRYCLQNWETPQDLERHLWSHPLKTRNEKLSGFACLICEVRLSGNAQLAAHMQKHHVSFDLPYRCACCTHASSALRCSVDHFYTEHASAASMQCPFCMQIYVAQDENDQPLPVNIAAYLEHLVEHMRPSGNCVNIRCNRCTLSFQNRGVAKMHQNYAHCSQNKRVNAALCRSMTKIAKPKYKYNHAGPLVNMVSRLDKLTMEVSNGLMCLECDADFEEKSHFPGEMACSRCTYRTCCQRAMITHGLNCASTPGDATVPAVGSSLGNAELEQEYHCICGVASTDGNKLAKHLLSCGRLSAYVSVESAQENTVKRNVLDMLGLMRRDGDDGTGGEEDVDGDDSILETSAVTDTANETAALEEPTDTDASVAGPPEPMEQDIDAAADEEATVANDASDSTSVDVERAAAVAPTNEAVADDHQHQFNTELSLDDLAAPASVAPPAPQPETDRTPQLSDEYQSLATPRIAQPLEHVGGNGNGEPMM